MKYFVITLKTARRVKNNTKLNPPETVVSYSTGFDFVSKLLQSLIGCTYYFFKIFFVFTIEI